MALAVFHVPSWLDGGCRKVDGGRWVCLGAYAPPLPREGWLRSGSNVIPRRAHPCLAGLQGCLAYQKSHHSRTLQKAYA